MNNHFDGIAPRLIESAARRAPAAISERLHEEWLADLHERHGLISRLRFGLGCLWAAMSISRDDCAGAALSSTIPVHAAFMSAAGGHHRPLYSRNQIAVETSAICDLNTTPLIDVMLVLLITMILSLPLLTHAVKLDLPHSSPIEQVPPPQAIDLDIDFDGTVLWNGTPVTNSGQLEGYFRIEAQKEPQAEIRLRPNAHVKYEFVAGVLASAQRNGLRKVGFVNTGEFTR